MPLTGGSAASVLLLRNGSQKRRELDLQRAFQAADTNNDGYLSVDEYVNVFLQRGIAITRDEVQMYFNVKDRDRDGRISFEEFCDVETVNEIAFRAIDMNDDGYITKDDMLQAFRLGTRRLSRSDVDKCFREYDKDRDNRLSYDEFCALLNNHKNASEAIIEATIKLFSPVKKHS